MPLPPLPALASRPHPLPRHEQGPLRPQRGVGWVRGAGAGKGVGQPLPPCVHPGEQGPSMGFRACPCMVAAGGGKCAKGGGLAWGARVHTPLAPAPPRCGYMALFQWSTDCFLGFFIRTLTFPIPCRAPTSHPRAPRPHWKGVRGGRASGGGWPCHHLHGCPRGPGPRATAASWALCPTNWAYRGLHGEQAHVRNVPFRYL